MLVQPLLFYPDTVTAYPFWDFRDPGRFAGDWFATAPLQVGFPPLHQALAWPFVQLLEPATALEALGLVCGIATVALVAAASAEISLPAAGAAAALALTMDSVHGGYPRALGLVLTAAILCALGRGRPIALAGLLPVAVFAYPMVVPPGAATALAWTAARRRGRREAVAVVLLVAVALGLGLWRSSVTAGVVGPACGPTDCLDMPEFAIATNYTFSSVRGAFVLENILNIGERTRAFGPVLSLLLAGALVGWARARSLGAAGWLLLGGVAGYAGVEVLTRLHPMPTGFASRSLVFVLPLAAAHGWGRAADKLGPRLRIAAAVAPALLGLALFRVHHVYDDHRHLAPLFAAVRALPPGSIVGGHPILVDPVPLVTGRRVEVIAQAFNPWMRDWWREYKRRMWAALETTYAATPDEVRAGCAKAGITHVAVEYRLFQPEHATAPARFDWEPMASEVRRMAAVGPHALARGLRPGQVCLYDCRTLAGPCWLAVPEPF